MVSSIVVDDNPEGKVSVLYGKQQLWQRIKHVGAEGRILGVFSVSVEEERNREVGRLRFAILVDDYPQGTVSVVCGT